MRINLRPSTAVEKPRSQIILRTSPAASSSPPPTPHAPSPTPTPALQSTHGLPQTLLHHRPRPHPHPRRAPSPRTHLPHPRFGLEPADFERRTAPDYWEVGASGRRYSRDFILQTLADNPPADAATLRWRASGHALRQLGPDTYLLTYSLRQQDRLTRRSTLWQRTPTGWQILYHQGTPSPPTKTTSLLHSNEGA